MVDNTKKLYDAISSNGYEDLGDYSDFNNKLKDSGKREILYNKLKEDGFEDIGSFSDFNAKLGYSDIDAADQGSGKGFWDTWVGDAVEKLNAGGAMIGKNLFGVLDKAAIGLEKAGLGTRGGAFKQASDYFKGVEEASRANSDRYNGKSYSDLWKEGDYAGAIGDIALQGIESIPISISAAAATMAGAPVAGLAGIGALTANEKYDQLDKENSDMDEFSKVTNAILTGTAEGVSEMLGAGVSKAWMKTLYKSLGKDKAEEAIKRGLMGQIQKHYKEFGMFYEPIGEGIEEVASQLAENITDKMTGADPDRDITDGLKDSFVYGMGGGAYFSAAGVPGFSKRQYDKMKTRKDLKNARENFKSVFADNEKMLGIESELESSTPEEKAGFLAAINESKQFIDKEKEAIGLLVDADMNYRSMRTPEAVQEEKAERRELAIQTEMVNYDNAVSDIIAPNGMIQQVFVNGDTQNPVAIIDGNVVLDQKEDGTMFVDSKNSTPVLYYKDADGKTLPISPKNVTDIYNVVNAQDQRAQYEANLRAQLDMQDQMRAQQRKQEEAMEISNEDSVSYIDPDTGKQVNGVVRDINPDGETMSVEIDGGKLANVPKNIVVKSTIQTTSVEPEGKSDVGNVEQKAGSSLNNGVETQEVSAENVAENVAEIPTDAAENLNPNVEVEKQDQTVKPSPVVLKEDGTPDFVASGDEATFDFLQEKYGGKMQRKVEVTKNALDADLKKAQEALQKAEQSYDDAPIGKEDKAEKALQKAKETYDAIKKEADFWTGLNETVAKANEKPGDQISKEIKEMGDPLNGEELSAQMLATGSIKLTRDSYKRETGAGNQESKKMFGLFASPEKGGVNIERAGELVMLADLEAGTNFFDQNDPNAGRNAIIEVLSSARTRGDLINYIRNAREQRAEQERQAEYNEYAAWCEENYYMPPEDYEAYEEQIVRDFMDKRLSEEEQNELNGQIADEIQAIREEQKEIDAILAQNKQNNNEEFKGNDESGGNGLREGSSEILQGEQSDQTGRTGEVETGESVGSGIDSTDGAAQESASGEVDTEFAYSLSNTVSDNGENFYQDSSGNIDLATIPDEVFSAIGKKSAPFRLIPSMLKHVFDRHGREMSLNSPQDAILFVLDVIDNFDHVRQGNNGTLIFSIENGRSRTGKRAVTILLDSKSGDYYGIKTSGYERIDGLNKSALLWEKGAKETSTTDVASANVTTAKAQQGNEQSGSASNQSNALSTAKDSESVSNGKEKSQENETSFEMMRRIALEQKMKRDISDAEQQVDVNPTDAQKEAGNYKKGHVNIDGYDITIEQPAGSVRSGKDADGKEWSVTMNNTYGYIRGTEGVDGDHIDIFLSDSPVSGRVYVVDQVNKDGSFDEHKVMYGFNSEEEAKAAYLSNYSPGWKGLGNITEISKGDFKKWIDSSKRKTKPFADYKIADKTDGASLSDVRVISYNVGDTVTIKYFDGTYVRGVVEKASNGKVSVRSILNSRLYTVPESSVVDDSGIRFRESKDEIASFAQKHNINENDVRSYADAMQRGSLGGASYAFKNIHRTVRLANDNLSLGQFVKMFSPIKEELYKRFGNVDALREEQVQKSLEERNAMEAARKRAEEEAEAERKRLEEFELMSEEALDSAYFKAVEANDENRMRDIINEAARRKGYLSTDEFRMAHRAPSYDEEGIDKSMVDVANNKDSIRESLNEQLRMNRDKNRDESAEAINTALDAINKGEKPTVTIYRSVPKSLKEGKVRNGDWVTLSESYAKQHGNHALDGNYRIMKEEVPAENLYWDGNDINEWGYDDKSDYKYKDVKNNRKLNDLITRDDKGNIIPPSKRFNSRKSDPRFRFIGEKGAANLDKAEEATTRLDNLSVAREMEKSGKDAKAIKLATGWERGADGKWRYEVDDFDVDVEGLARKNNLYANLPWGKEYDDLSDKLFDGKELTEEELSRFDELLEKATEMRKLYESSEVRYLDDYVKDDELFKAYPDLKQVRVEMYNEPMSNTGAIWFSNQNLIRVNESALERADFRSILAHEVQHAVQTIEGFTRGGNSETYRKHLDALKDKRDAWSMIEEFVEKKKELGEDASQMDVYRAIVDEYLSDGFKFGDGFIPTRDAFDKGFNLWVRGYDKEGYEDAYNEYQRLIEKFGLGHSNNRYEEISGEVEARNVETRMDMTPEERRSSLASETEDVAREDQLFLDNAFGGVSASISTEVDAVNQKFNEELQKQIDGTLPKGHVYQLGNPSEYLQAAGIPNLPIELPASQLEYKATSGKHDYDLSEIINLPEAIANPIATFSYGDKGKSQNILTVLEHNGENFLVGMFIRPTVKGRILEVNSVRNVFPKNNDSIVRWILDGKLTNINKEKLLNFLDQQRTNYADVASVLPDEQVKQRNSEVSSATKVVESFVNPTLEEGKISSSVEELSESLNTPVHIIRDVNEITDDNKSLQRQKRGSKGWYDTNTGEVYLVLPNTESVADAQATILHEAVAHKGLRGLLGDNFGATMDSIFDSLPQEVQDGLMNEYGDKQVAAEEYCAEMAETMSDPGIIQKICSAIKDALRKIGIDLKMSDGDIMYMLWRSKNRLEKSDTAFDVMRKVKTDAKVREQSKEYDNLFRSKKPLSKLGLSDDQQRRIEGKIQSRSELFQEAYVDRMISVRKLQEEVEKAIGKKIPDYMNVYVYENTLSSRNTYEQSQFEQKRIKPLYDAIKALREKGYSEREIENYVIAKHGIERNEYMRYAVLEKAINAIKDDVIKQQLLSEIAGKKFSDLTQLSDQKMEDLRQSLMDRDFAGLTGVYADMKGFKDFKEFKEQMKVDGKTVTDFMPEIEKFISDMEADNGQEVKNLWDKISAVNDYSLKKWFDTGMINRKTYDKIKGMYSNYVPLRGFSEAQMSDVFDYVNDRDIVYNETVKTAGGRPTRPDSPFAYMASMGDSAIVGGNKNQMKLHLYRIALEGVTDMLTVNKQWYEVSYDANGNEIWTPAYPVYDEDPAVYRKNIEDFEADMLLKQSQGLADTKRGKLTNDLDEKSQRNLRQHAVKVKLNGEEYVIYVNGNPKVAQAINGLNSPELAENKVLKVFAWTNRQMAANFTTRNPAFVLSNLSRDLIWATSTLSVKENKKYRNKFVGNVPNAMKALKDRIKAGENWEPDQSDPISVMLDEFLRNGARTGYTALYNIDKYKKRIEDATKTGKKAEAKRKVGEVLDAMGMLNEWAEDVSRFATFMTSRQMGRSLLQSTYDAKEVTVNFNKKGSGAMGNEWFRAFYIFFNAAVQSLNNAATMAIKNPVGTAKLVGFYALAGTVVPMLLQTLGDDEDRERYMGLPDYIRKNNVCIPLSVFGSDGFLKIPLPIELRALYGMGDSALRYMLGYDEGTEALTDATMGMMDLLPLNPVGGASSYVPSYLQPVVESYFTNTDFTGKPIAKITPFNEYNPEYQRVYKSTGVIPIKVSEYLNLLSGGDEAKRKFEILKTPSGADLLNPASVEHLFEAYLGGAFTFVNQSFKTFVGTPLGLNEFTSRNVPVLNRFYDTGEVDGTMMKVNEQFFDYVDDAKKAQATYRNYEKLIDNSPSLESAKFFKKLKDYEQSDEWERAEYILDMQDKIKDLNDEVKESNNEEYVKSLKDKIESMKKEMVESLKGGKVPA